MEEQTKAPETASTVTFYFRNVPHKVVLFRGMPLHDIEACLFNVFRLPFSTQLIYRDAEGSNVPLTSYLPSGYNIHVQLKAAEGSCSGLPGCRHCEADAENVLKSTAENR